MGLFSDKFTLLIVCKANITRSAYVEGYMKHYLKEHLPHARRKIRIISAGVRARRGGSASQVVRHVAKRNGFSLKGHYSSPLTKKLLKSAHAVLVMEQGQKEAIVSFFPPAKAKTFRLTEYLRNDDERPSGDIPDPTGLNSAEYQAFLDVAHNEVDRIFRELGREGII